MAYVDEVIKEVTEKNSNEPEFIQAVTEVLESLRPVVEADDRYEKNAILERMCEPERIVSFRVPWVDDAGKVQVNRGFRAQFNSAIGPYKGGIRLHPSVNQSIIKFLGFDQTFKNSLTGLPIGGGKGGSDFNPKGKSDGEIMRFCQSFMTELYRYIGPDTDCPAGDIGCGSKEIGYMFGMYKRIVGGYKNGALSGKGIPYGGSLGRNEATGYGAVYFTEELFESVGKKLAGTTFALSGFGNVSWGVAKKLNELGAKVVSISGPDGYIYDKDGISGEKVDYMVEMRGSLRDRCEDYVDRFGVEFHAGEKPWGRVKADVYMPCATQNEIGLEDAKRMIEEGTSKLLIEVGNMPTKAEAVEELQKAGFMIAPSKAVNAGGVAVSALEMSQNAMKLSWTEEEVDEKLKKIMKNIFNNIDSAAKKYGMDGNLIAGANIAGFLKVAEAMLDEGIF